MMDNFPKPVKILLSATFKTFKEGPFVTKTVGELMWGYESKLLDLLNTLFPGMMPFKGKFGLFVEVRNRLMQDMFLLNAWCSPDRCLISGDQDKADKNV